MEELGFANWPIGWQVVDGSGGQRHRFYLDENWMKTTTTWQPLEVGELPDLEPEPPETTENLETIDKGKKFDCEEKTDQMIQSEKKPKSTENKKSIK